jgi:hypothetical protein
MGGTRIEDVWKQEMTLLVSDVDLRMNIATKAKENFNKR